MAVVMGNGRAAFLTSSSARFEPSVRSLLPLSSRHSHTHPSLPLPPSLSLPLSLPPSLSLSPPLSLPPSLPLPLSPALSGSVAKGRHRCRLHHHQYQIQPSDFRKRKVRKQRPIEAVNSFLKMQVLHFSSYPCENWDKMFALKY